LVDRTGHDRALLAFVMRQELGRGRVVPGNRPARDDG
jgi:hypothetical protein